MNIEAIAAVRRAIDIFRCIRAHLVIDTRRAPLPAEGLHPQELVWVFQEQKLVGWQKVLCSDGTGGRCGAAEAPTPYELRRPQLPAGALIGDRWRIEERVLCDGDRRSGRGCWLRIFRR